MRCRSARIHARLENLQGHLAADGLHLLGHEDDTEATLADLFEQFVRADDAAGAFAPGMVDRGSRLPGTTAMNAALLLVGVQEFINPRPQLGVTATGFLHERGPLVGWAVDGSQEDRTGLVFDCAHVSSSADRLYQPVRRSLASSSHDGGRIPGGCVSFNSSDRSHARA